MNATLTRRLVAAVIVCAAAFSTTIAYAVDALPSWNEGVAKKSVVEFVAKVTKEGGPDFVPSAITPLAV